MPKPPLIFWHPFGRGGSGTAGPSLGVVGCPGDGGDGLDQLWQDRTGCAQLLCVGRRAAGTAAPSRNSSGKQMKCLKGYCEYRLKYDPLASANFSDKILQGLLFLSK